MWSEINCFLYKFLVFILIEGRGIVVIWVFGCIWGRWGNVDEIVVNCKESRIIKNLVIKIWNGVEGIWRGYITYILIKGL